MNETELAELAARYRAGGMGYGEVKKQLFERMWEYFAPYREKRAQLEANLDFVHEVMQKGADKAREIAAPTLKDVRRKVGLNYREI